MRTAGPRWYQGQCWAFVNPPASHQSWRLQGDQPYGAIECLADAIPNVRVLRPLPCLPISRPSERSVNCFIPFAAAVLQRIAQNLDVRHCYGGLVSPAAYQATIFAALRCLIHPTDDSRKTCMAIVQNVKISFLSIVRSV